MGAKGLDKLAKVDKLGDARDASKAASTVDNTADISKLEKIDDVPDISRAGKLDVDNLSDISKAGQVGVDDLLKTVEAAKSQGAQKSIFNDVFDAADHYTLSDDTYINHILDIHGPSSAYLNKSHFNANFDIKNAIDNTLKGDNFIIKANTNGREGYIFERAFKNAIGTSGKGKPLYTMKVVIDKLGNVITAFPKK